MAGREESIYYNENKRRFSWQTEDPMTIAEMEYGDIVEIEYNDRIRLIMVIDNNYENKVHAVDISTMEPRMAERVFNLFLMKGVSKTQLYENMTKLQIDKSYRTFRPELIGLPILILRMDQTELKESANFVKIGGSILIGYDEKELTLPLNHEMVYIDLIPLGLKNGLYFKDAPTPKGNRVLEKFVDIHFTSALRRINYHQWYKDDQLASLEAEAKKTSKPKDILAFRQAQGKVLRKMMEESSGVFFAERGLLSFIK